ncbi:MAG: 23S rRNA (guanosine(2251)-2'-O)-methyltransferase RlmB [Chloroflexi bacterium]|nr:23S rRNA (guanosine(2251)-2'-O)-methyltransferase RlmB [Chloroflexota bacterium]
MPEQSEFLAGRNAVHEALLAGRRRFIRVIISEGVVARDILYEITKLCQERRIALQQLPRETLDRLSPEIRHQGVLAEVSSYPYVEPEDLLNAAKTSGRAPFMLVLDNLQDPQNVGSLLRTAEAVGVHGVFIHAQHAVGITPAVSRASAGAVEHLAVAEQTNLASTLRWLKQKGIWIIGVEEHPQAQDYRALKYDMPLALVVGSEGSGLRRLTIEECDFIASIPMVGKIHSLNAAVAGSLLLYQVFNSHSA